MSAVDAWTHVLTFAHACVLAKLFEFVVLDKTLSGALFVTERVAARFDVSVVASSPGMFCFPSFPRFDSKCHRLYRNKRSLLT